jgi:hypothetical protein
MLRRAYVAMYFSMLSSLNLFHRATASSSPVGYQSQDSKLYQSSRDIPFSILTKKFLASSSVGPLCVYEVGRSAPPPDEVSSDPEVFLFEQLRTHLLHPSGFGSLLLNLLLLFNYSVDLDIDLKQVVNWISQELLL